VTFNSLDHFTANILSPWNHGIASFCVGFFHPTAMFVDCIHAVADSTLTVEHFCFVFVVHSCLFLSTIYEHVARFQFGLGRMGIFLFTSFGGHTQPYLLDVLPGGNFRIRKYACFTLVDTAGFPTCLHQCLLLLAIREG
jgi:hypothetical protein